MIVDFNPRQSGKTTRAISWMIAKKKRGIVCPSYQMRDVKRDFCVRFLEDLKMDRVEAMAVAQNIIAADEYTAKGKNLLKEVFVDDGDMVLMRLFDNCVGYSASNDDPSIKLIKKTY